MRLFFNKEIKNKEIKKGSDNRWFSMCLLLPLGICCSILCPPLNIEM